MRKLVHISDFIKKNTVLDYSILSFLKAGLIFIPLVISLQPYIYFSEAFLKALFLYSCVLAFDMALQWHKSLKERGILLFICSIFLFVFAVFLVGTSILGMYCPEYIHNIIEEPIFKRIVHVAIYSQTAWFVLEFLLLMLKEAIETALKEKKQTKPIKVSQETDGNMNL